MATPLRAALTALLLAAALAPAARADYVIEPAQERQVHAGMTKAEVLALLGKPSADRRFPNGLSTWTYEARRTDERALFDIEFDVAEHVRTFGRRYPGGY